MSFMTWIASKKRCRGVPETTYGCPHDNRGAKFTWETAAICNDCLKDWQASVRTAHANGQEVETSLFESDDKIDVLWRMQGTKKWNGTQSGAFGRWFVPRVDKHFIVG